MPDFPSIPGYDILRKIGEGGFGIVWQGVDKISGREVAIKTLKSLNKEDQEEIIEEIQLLAKFQHPNIVTYFHPISVEDSIHFVMEYCEHGNLYAASHKATSEQIISWTIDCLHALASVHSDGIFHNDLKPGNLLMNSKGQVKISDFGCANLYRGTVSFMPPEFLSGDHASNRDPRRDVYAMGLSLLELLTGTNPFYSLEREEIIQKHITGDIPLGGIPTWLQEVILKAIHRVPELRFQSASDFAEALAAKHVPSVLNPRKLIAGNISEKIIYYIAKKKWVKASSLVEEGLNNYPEDVSICRAAGNYFLNRNQIEKAQQTFLKALSLNPRIDVQKELGICQLELGNYPQAISLLNDHLSRSGLDMQAYNSLIRCYFETNRYEYAIQLCDQLLANKDLRLSYVYNNRLICQIMLGHRDFPELTSKTNPFIVYNLALLEPQNEYYDENKGPFLKSKLLFQEVRFANLSDFQNSCWLMSIDQKLQGEIIKGIFTLGRTGYSNDYKFGENNVSRKHAVIINQKNDIWIYDLDSTGIWIDDVRINKKAPLLYNCKLDFNGFSVRFLTSLEKVV